MSVTRHNLNFVLCLLLFVLSNTIAARHIHHALEHQHIHRYAQPAPATPLPDLHITEDAVTNDIAKVEAELPALPADVIQFLVAVDNELQKAESLLTDLINSIAVPSTSTTSTSNHSVSATSQLSSLSATPSSVASLPSQGASITPTASVLITTVHRTSTIYITRTVFDVTPTAAPSNSTQQHYKPTRRGTANMSRTSSSPNGVGSLSSSRATRSSRITMATSLATSASPGPSSAPSTTLASSAGQPAYSFDAASSSNVAVYYGQSPNTRPGDLVNLCKDANVDMVILAFVTSFFTPSGWPSASFGRACSGSTPAQQLHAPGLQNCTALAPEILECQQIGKKVLVSLGGYTGTTSIPTEGAAEQLADNMWNLFGAGETFDPTLRPFGPNVTVDGFDLDNEGGDPAYYDTLAFSLRLRYLSDKSKDYYLTAAPQCPRPDASIPMAAMALADFVFVQFYNNPSCNLDSVGFQDSFSGWSKALAAASNSTRVYVGAGAFQGAGSGYVAGAELGARIDLVKSLNVSNLGGMMLWDGSEALANVDENGEDYLNYTKAALL